MRDLDEFQREMFRRAAFRAYLVGAAGHSGLRVGRPSGRRWGDGPGGRPHPRPLHPLGDVAFQIPPGVLGCAEHRHGRPSQLRGVLAVLLGKPSSEPWATSMLTLTTLAVPILASGLGLVRSRGEETGAE